MSIVYEAFDPHINRHLAVKVLRERYARDLTSRQRFLREARSAGGLSHPNIVTVFDVGQHEGLPYLVMERLSGQSLEEYLDDGGTLDSSGILSIGIQLASALDYAHERNIIHRDVKPSNIYFDPESGLVKLVDFGIAAIIDRQHSERGAESERPDTIAGTPKFMAPEQIQGSELDGRADLYALGVVLYRLLSGEPPFNANSMGALVHQIVYRPPPKLHAHDDHTPLDLIDLVHRLLAKEPDARPASGRAVLEELQETRADMERGLLKTVRGTPALWRWLAVFGLMLIVVLGGGLGWVYQSQTAAMAESTYGYGDALARVIARETAEALMLDDTSALATLVADFSRSPRVSFLHISDRSGRVQASTNPYLQGEPRPGLDTATVVREAGGVRLLSGRDEHFEFRTPISYQTHRIGEVQIGIDSRQLTRAARITLGMLGLIFTLSLIVIGTGFSLMHRQQQRSVQRVGRGLTRIARGQYDTRLEADRQDPLAPLSERFNDMAKRLEERHGFVKRRPAESVLPDLTEFSSDATVEVETPIDDTKVLPLTDRKSRRSQE